MIHVINNPSASRFEAEVEDSIAVADYVMRGNVMVITHVGVPRALENRGIASTLVKTAAEHAKAHGLTIQPVCSFAAAYFQRHPEYAALVAR